jgi:ribosomal-protein-alanine N-acetyltransferase
MSSIPVPTTRLLLREYSVDDFEGVHAYAKDEETVQFMTWGPNTLEDTVSFIQSTIVQRSIQPRVHYHFVVVLQENLQIIGGCGIHITRPEHRTAEIGYCFNKLLWGQGYATETAGALLKFGFESLNLHRIEATCDTHNLGSARVMEKNGMRREGHFREHLWQKGEWRDTYLYAILDHEWKNN